MYNRKFKKSFKNKGRFETQHYEEVELVYYWDWELVVPVIMSVLGSLHFDIVLVVVVE
jgi:hypothetical protein